METLKKAGAMLAHLELFQHMLDLRRLLQLAAHMEERGDRVMLVSDEQITLIGTEALSDAAVTTAKGATVDAATAYRMLQQLKGFESPEYTVNREELSALNARAVSELEGSDALRAFGETLNRIGAGAGSQAPTAQAASTQSASAQSGSAQAADTSSPTEPPSERPTRGRRQPEGAEAEAAAR